MSGSSKRGSLDVAMELTDLYCKEYIVEDEKELQEIFTKFYAIAEYCQHKSADDLKSLIPDVVKRHSGW
ncbi:hypothetical protein [Evansella cellulosilytica]|uniref:Uncharacterized protein n=1 Tax=Evansella cellulosilytica (strain ATCC 21833 / DSM 2522 / FERM P-1141 / JCM 9156 / N-4) TaxID=649639 RepID=E6TUC1_EVAC2|nr:hypothetical protein [Evansella cellulosilytica]ADU29677.1 hypothetical protein Bcell_1414 [Evansella cellulosilytica DSM 2522]